LKFRLALLPALLVAASALLVAAVRILLLLLARLALSALLRIALLLLTRLAVRIILVLWILVRIGHCGSPLWRHHPTNQCVGARNVPEVFWFHRGGTIYRNSGPERAPSARVVCTDDCTNTRECMMRYGLLWLLGVPLPILLLIFLFGGLH
jgi:hypothetical protein